MRDQLVDGHGRDIGDVRISVTDRCNFRCQYCMPAEGLPWLDRDDILSYEEIARVTGLLASMGVHDVRLTGGEPLARRELWKLVEILSADENIHDLSLTTNGYLLERQVEKLVAAGLRRGDGALDAPAPGPLFPPTRPHPPQQGLAGPAAPPRPPPPRPLQGNLGAPQDL